jgi:hypothetical protein
MTEREGPRVADGEPFVGQLVGVLDESAHQAAAGVYYVVGVAVVLNATDVTGKVRSLIEHRTNPIHWMREGPAMRSRIVELLGEVVVGATIRWSSVGRRGQLSLRSDLLGSVARWAAAEGVDHLVIESADDAINMRDRQTLGRLLRDNVDMRSFHYDHRSKAEPLLWLADALAGAVGDHLIGKDSAAYERLVELGVISPV